MMNIGVNASAIGGHLGGWRHKDSWFPSVTRLDNVILTAKLAEQGKLDLIFLADGNGVRNLERPDLLAANSPTDRPAVFEPTTLFAAVSQHVNNVGFVATATTTYEEPYLLARKFASLDLISGGRCAWNLVTTSSQDDALNFSRSFHPSREERYPRAKEFASVVQKLWDSWESDAFPQDRSSGRYLDPSKVHVANHKGDFFSVRGPLNAPRSPQGRPVIFSAGQSEEGIDTSAQYADAVFASAPTKEDAVRFYNKIKSRVEFYGRSPDSFRVMPEVTLFLGKTSSEADQFAEELQELVPIDLGVSYLSKLLDTELSDLPLDGPVPNINKEHVGMTEIGRQVVDRAVRENLTIRQVAKTMLASTTGSTFRGDPEQIANQMEDWYRSGACDGFIIANPVMPKSLSMFVELVVPLLQKRGIFRSEYPGTTLRETMGLPVPESQFL